MQQPTHDLRPFQASIVSPRRFISIGLVGLLHVIMIYALATGLAQQLVKKLPDEFKAEVVQEKPPEQEKTPPPPPPDLVKPPPPFVPPPDFTIQADAGPTTAIANVQSRQPVQPTGIVPPKAIGRSHNCDALYPPISQRLSEQGTVTVRYAVDVDGSVGAVTVEKSSGYSRLDEAAVRCVQTRWRQKPATQNGKPIALTTLAKILFKFR